MQKKNINQKDICGSAFEDLSDSEMMMLDGGNPAITTVATTSSSGPCLVISASVSATVSITVLVTNDKI